MIRIKQLREEKGWTLEYIATRVNVTNQTISNWEKGKTEPYIGSLIRLAELFQVTVDYLIAHDKYAHDVSDLKMRIGRMDSETLRKLTLDYLDLLNDEDKK